MATIELKTAQSQLVEIVSKLKPGEELFLTQDGELLAKLIRTEQKRKNRKAGSAKDQITWISPDFDAPLEEFKEYME